MSFATQLPSISARFSPTCSSCCGKWVFSVSLNINSPPSSFGNVFSQPKLANPIASVALTERILRVKERDSSRLHGFIFVTVLNRLYIFLNVVYIISFLLIRFSGFYNWEFGGGGGGVCGGGGGGWKFRGGEGSGGVFGGLTGGVCGGVVGGVWGGLCGGVCGGVNGRGTEGGWEFGGGDGGVCGGGGGGWKFRGGEEGCGVFGGGASGVCGDVVGGV
uniref:Uncharacterized protein n=1 Tax=Brassica oleracea var. oleracea TaxID=109376 RepID=A0A0D3BKY6_BRAOL